MKNTKYIGIIAIILITILLRAIHFANEYKEDLQNKKYVLMIKHITKATEDKITYNVLLGQKTNNSYRFTDEFILNIYKDKYSDQNQNLNQYMNFKYGDVIEVNGKISIPKLLNNPGEFNYKTYLYSNNIYGIINTYKEPILKNIETGVIHRALKAVYAYKSNVYEIISKVMNGKAAGVTKAIIYGNKTDIEESINTNFKELGISHMMSISGSDISSVMIIFSIFFKQSKSKKAKNIISIFAALLFVIFAEFSMSIIRAAIMLIIFCIFKLMGKRVNALVPFFITFLLINIYCPFAIFNVGLQLSFMAVLGIILFAKYIERLLDRNTKKENKIVKSVKTAFIKSIAVILSVQMMVIPIQISSFNQISFPLIIPNIIINIFVIPIKIIGIFATLLSFANHMSSYLFILIKYLVLIVIKLSNLLKNISVVITLKSLPGIVYVLYYLVIASAYITLKLNKLDNSKMNLRKLIKRINVLKIVMIILVVTTVIAINIYATYLSSYVYFFNVEQGDMSYIKCGEKSVIVDIGSLKNQLAFNVISNFFKSENINKVDLVIISHMHSDHVNGLKKLAEKYRIGEIIYVKPIKETDEYTKFKQIIKDYKIRSRQVKSGDEISIGYMKIEILLPYKMKGETIKNEDENANSIVCKINANNTSLLYMGDAGKEAEEKLIKLKKLDNIDILKVGHHGSKNSTSLDFLKSTKPKHAIISSNKKYYGHPSEATLDRLRENNIYTYITENIGAIKFNLK